MYFHSCEHEDNITSFKMYCVCIYIHICMHTNTHTFLYVELDVEAYIEDTKKNPVVTTFPMKDHERS